MYCQIWQPYTRGHFAMSGDSLDCHNWGRYWHLVGRGQRCCSTPCNTGWPVRQRSRQPIMALLWRLRSLCAGSCPECSPSISSSTRQDSPKGENPYLFHLMDEEPEEQGPYAVPFKVTEAAMEKPVFIFPSVRICWVAL